MSRLNLDQFKKETVKKEKNVQELEKLTGGILGACHVEPKGTGGTTIYENGHYTESGKQLMDLLYGPGNW